MAVKNSIVTRTDDQTKKKEIVYQVNGDEVKLSADTVRNYLVNGSGTITNQEIAYFINLCKYQRLNPFIKDAYLIKYGNQPATIVTSKDAILKRALKNPRYAGHQAGVIVMKNDTNELEYRPGSFVIPGESLIGGWAKTFIQGCAVPIETAVSFEEYAGKTKEGRLNSMWAGKPGTMIRKVALVACLREAFPEDLQGMYASEEVNADIDDTMVAPVEYPNRPEETQNQQIVTTGIPPELPEIEPEQQTITIDAENIGAVTEADELEGVF